MFFLLGHTSLNFQFSELELLGCLFLSCEIFITCRNTTVLLFCCEIRSVINQLMTRVTSAPTSATKLVSFWHLHSYTRDIVRKIVWPSRLCIHAHHRPHVLRFHEKCVLSPERNVTILAVDVSRTHCFMCLP